MSTSTEYYVHQQEVWDRDKCLKASRRIATDGMGTPYPFPGYIGSHQTGYGKQRYNGGCVRDGKWYCGEEKPLPKVADGFKIITVVSWGFRIVQG